MSERQEQEPAPKPRRVGRPRNLTKSPEFEEKRRAIIEAAAKIFRDKGYDRGSLDDVAEALDIRKATLYYYVKSKAELVGLIFETALSAAREDIHRLEAIDDPAERLKTLIRYQIQNVTRDLSHFSVFFDHFGNLDQHSSKTETLKALEKAYFQSFSQTIERAIAANCLPGVNPRYATQCIIGMTCWTYKWFDPSRHSAEDLAETCIQLLLGPPTK